MKNWKKEKSFCCPICGRHGLWHNIDIAEPENYGDSDKHYGNSEGNFYCIYCNQAFAIADEDWGVWLNDDKREEIEKYANNLKVNQRR